ncbi:diacylglycerol kinase family lipid kinase [Marivirga sp. S37H4]|uniref:Diacylglycerol kinase family lipid kinase n=1 Tax=Marivirga aurantiaca TaxID=2802615 RepID=A0A934X0Z9_9BACT|nr:diacylglycerol kinase family protein [Marivirga aurantiaca]MBK6266689.1 diacylglycerol kinase family lipid kinase [Marivirga aurantiaca]
MSPIDYLFIVNPKSGNTDKSALESNIDSACNAHNRKYTILYTTGVNDPEKIKEKISISNPKTVVACGGDGTINLLAKLLLDTEVSLGIIPLGSANGLANELDIPENIEDSLLILMENTPQPMDVVVINDEHISLHLSDVGFNANMIQDFENNGERGKLAYAKSFFNSLSEKEATDFTVELNDQSFEVTAEMIVFANASSYGTGAIINPDSSMNDGFFEVIVFKPIPMGDLVSLTFSSFFGDINNSDFVEIYKTNSAKIRCHTKELLQIDGELMGEVSEIKVEIKKAAIHILAPSNFQ